MLQKKLLTLILALIIPAFAVKCDIIFTDSDGIEDDWEFLQFQNLSTADETTDTDHDKFIDLFEFYAGTQATKALATSPKRVAVLIA